MTRLTRTESQARTRAHLVAAARDLFLADGFAKTSLESVADAAGYSKGAVYSNFRNKKELCLEVLELIHVSKFGEVSELLAGGATVEQSLERFQAWAERTLGDVGWTMLEFEFAVVARADPELQASLVASLGVARRMVASILESFAESLGVTLPIPIDDAAGSLLSLGIGLGIQRAVDPTISARFITDGLRMLIALASVGDLASSKIALGARP